jgi:hypothetical protein
MFSRAENSCTLRMRCLDSRYKDLHRRSILFLARCDAGI